MLHIAFRRVKITRYQGCAFQHNIQNFHCSKSIRHSSRRSLSFHSPGRANFTNRGGVHSFRYLCSFPSPQNNNGPCCTAAVNSSLSTKLVSFVKQTFHDAIDLAKFYRQGFSLMRQDYRGSKELHRKDSSLLTRAEIRLMARTKRDISLLIFPFSCFLWVPFSFYALPFVIKYMPHTLPTRFVTPTQKKDIDDNYLNNVLPKVYETIRGEFKGVHSIEQNIDDWILKVLPRFQNKSVDTLPKESVQDLCRLLRISPYGRTSKLCFSLDQRLALLIEDAQLIRKEGFTSLSNDALIEACLERGISIYHSDKVLRYALESWLHVCTSPKLPKALLLSQGVFGADMNFVPDHVKQMENTHSHLSKKSAKSQQNNSLNSPLESNKRHFSTPPQYNLEDRKYSNRTLRSHRVSKTKRHRFFHNSNSRTSNKRRSHNNRLYSSSVASKKQVLKHDVIADEHCNTTDGISNNQNESSETVFTNINFLNEGSITTISGEWDDYFSSAAERWLDRKVLEWDKNEEAEDVAIQNHDPEEAQRQLREELRRERENELKFGPVYAKKVFEKQKQEQAHLMAIYKDLEAEIEHQDEIRLKNYESEFKQRTKLDNKKMRLETELDGIWQQQRLQTNHVTSRKEQTISYKNEQDKDFKKLQAIIEKHKKQISPNGV